MKVPNCKQAVVPHGKITDYLLCIEHPEGGPKARFFMRWGFTLQQWEFLASALTQQVAGHEYEILVKGRFGTKYVVSAPLDAPKGVTPPVKTVWMIDNNSNFPRLISAYPA